MRTVVFASKNAERRVSILASVMTIVVSRALSHWAWNRTLLRRKFPAYHIHSIDCPAMDAASALLKVKCTGIGTTDKPGSVNNLSGMAMI